jgi:regulatory protein
MDLYDTEHGDAAERGEAPAELVITDVQTQVKRAERRSIFINGEFALGISEETYVRYALYRGRAITPELLEEVRREDELFQCKQTAMRFLERRMRSRQEVERKLAGKEYSPEAIDATLRFLAEYGMIDDREFARVFVGDQLLRRPLGRRRLGDELRRKGIEKEEIAETLKSAIGDADELANAMAAAEKKARTIRHDDPRKWERSMASFLAGRGFGWDVVSKVLERFRAERKENDTDQEIIDD